MVQLRNSILYIKLNSLLFIHSLLYIHCLYVTVGINIKKSLDIAREIMDIVDIAREIMDIVCMDCIVLQHITILIF